jgi:hypothetical protein
MAEKTEEIVSRRPKPKAPAAATKPLKGTTAVKATSTSATEDGPQRVSGPLTRTAKAKAASAPPTDAPAASPSKVAPVLGFFRRLGGNKEQTEAPALANTAKGGAAPAASAAKPQRPAAPGMGKFFFGMMLYMVLAFAAQFVLAFVFSHVPGKGQQVLFTVPLLGPVTEYLLVWMLTLIVILWGLYKLKILPRTLGQPREKVAAVKADPKATAKPAEAKAPREPLSGPNDDAYERVKAEQRSRRRKARRH